MEHASHKEAWSFHRLLLISTLIITAIFVMRYADFVQSGKAHFAEDFAVFQKALTVFDTSPVASPYHTETDALYFAGEGDTYHPYLNPPFFLLLIWPLHLVSAHTVLLVFYGVQCALWFAVLYAKPVRALWPQLAESPKRYAATCLILSLPFILHSIFAGQSGMFYASLILLGTALLPSRPLLAGVVLGLVSCKPTLLPLIAVWLIAGSRVKAGIAFLTTIAALVAVSTFVWGVGIWPQWLAAIRLQAETMQMASIPLHWQMELVSFYAGLRMLTVPMQPAFIAQAILSLLSLFIVARMAYRKGQTPETLALLYSFIFLAGAYVMQYDTLVQLPALLILLHTGYRSAWPPATRIVMIIVCFYSIISPQLQAMGIPFGSIGVLLLCWRTWALARLN